MDPRFLDPEPVPSDGEAVLSPDQARRWREQGFVFVQDLFPVEAVEALRRFAEARFPAAGSAEALAITDFGSALTFPQPDPALNTITLHPRLLAAVAQLLKVPIGDIRLTQSDVWPKYGHAGRSGDLDNQDQRIHVDYPNHTLVHPAPWDRPEAVELILYLDDVADAGGATAVVPRSGRDDPAYPWPIVDSPGIGALDWKNDRESAERLMASARPASLPLRRLLYERERCVRFRPGSVLFYRHDTWHRGTPLRPGARRVVHNLTFRRADCEWISTLHVGWAWKAYHPDKFLERLLAAASLDQRAVLGFPQPGDPYWCSETIEAVEARYGVFGMDLAPYRAALRQGASTAAPGALRGRHPA